MMFRKVFLGALFASVSILHAATPSTYTVAFDGFQKTYPVVKPKPESPVNIVYINFRDDNAIVQAAAKALSTKIPKNVSHMVVLGDKANGLGVLVACESQCPWIILTAKETPIPTQDYIHYGSITSGDKTLYLNKQQAEALQGKTVVILDDVISTGGTMRAAVQLLRRNNINVHSVMCVATEGKDITSFNPGDDTSDLPLVKLTHLPVFE